MCRCSTCPRTARCLGETRCNEGGEGNGRDWACENAGHAPRLQDAQVRMGVEGRKLAVRKWEAREG